jgi:hypothetical protein
MKLSLLIIFILTILVQNRRAHKSVKLCIRLRNECNPTDPNDKCCVGTCKPSTTNEKSGTCERKPEDHK